MLLFNKIVYMTTIPILASFEFQETRPILQGELKALDSVIDDYKRHFELYETEEQQ